MYKVLLIDDEEIIIKGLQSVITWEDYNCMICGTAANGSEGLDKIRRLHPDIIFADICMEDMTGLDMLEKAAADIKKAKVIIITGYRDFEYAKKAISLGAAAFILKPTKLDEIKNTLEKVTEELDNEISEADDRKRLEKEIADGRLALRERVFSDILTKENEKWSSYDLKKLLHGMEMNRFVVVTTDVPIETGKEGYDYLGDLRQLISDIFQSPYKASVIFPTISGEISIIISSVNDSWLEKRRLSQILEQTTTAIGKMYSCRVSAGVSTIDGSIDELKNKYLESRQALEHRVYLESNTLIFYDDIPKILPLFEEEDSMYSVLLIEQILLGDAKSVSEVFKKIECRLKEIDMVQAKKIIINIIYKIYDSYDRFQGNGYQSDNHKFIFECVTNCDDCRKAIGLLRDLTMNMTEKIRLYNSRQNDIRLKKICEYIEKNYMHRITRTDIANYINVTPNYLSAFFEREMHKGLIEYVTCVRIDAAKRLLLETDYKVNEIAYQCGFQDIYYFSKMFKVRTGETPRDYRKNNQDNHQNEGTAH